MCAATQAILGTTLVLYKPATLQCLLDHTRLPGESEAQVAARWRDVAVSARQLP